jgi:hypothetical protein
MTVKHKTRGGSCRKLRGGNPFQFNSGAPYSGAGSSGMGPNIASLGASGGRRRGSRTRRGGSRKLRGGNPFQFNSGAPYSGAGSSGMGPNIASLGASGGRRRGSRTRRGGRRGRGRRSGKTTGGSILSTASMPFGLLGLQSWFKGAFKSKKD